MGSPLRIINDYILSNLNRLKRKELSHKSSSDEENELKKPISSENLRTLLISLVPNDLSIKDQIKWDKKIDDTVSCYEEYVNTVCGEALDGEERYDDKWDEFQSLLQSWDKFDDNYSLHY